MDDIVDAEATRKAGEGIRALMRTKRPQELKVIRQGCVIIAAMAEALKKAHVAGRGVTASVIEAEHVGSKMGAQEVRTLMSLDGGKTLRPFLVPVDKVVDPLQVYLSVRVNGYWAEGHVPLSKSANPAADKARAALKLSEANRIAAALERDGLTSPPLHTRSHAALCFVLLTDAQAHCKMCAHDTTIPTHTSNARQKRVHY